MVQRLMLGHGETPASEADLNWWSQCPVLRVFALAELLYLLVSPVFTASLLPGMGHGGHKPWLVLHFQKTIPAHFL